MPKPEKDEFKIRRGFKAPKGMRIVGADFKQQELRILAQVSGDKDLRHAIANGIDLHGLAAVRVFGLKCKPNEVETKHPEHRARVKAVQFGLIYGRGARSLAAALSISGEEAQKLVDDYFQTFPRVKKFTDTVHKQLVRDGFVEDIFGRRRYFPGVKSGKGGPKSRRRKVDRVQIRQLNAAKRAAQNFVIQGAGATITKLAMLRCHEHITKEHPGIQMILTLHDEIQFLVPNAEVDHFAAELPNLMCDLGLETFGFKVPMKVEVKVGQSWGEMQSWDGAKTHGK